MGWKTSDVKYRSDEKNDVQRQQPLEHLLIPVFLSRKILTPGPWSGYSSGRTSRNLILSTTSSTTNQLIFVANPNTRNRGCGLKTPPLYRPCRTKRAPCLKSKKNTDGFGWNVHLKDFFPTRSGQSQSMAVHTCQKGASPDTGKLQKNGDLFIFFSYQPAKKSSFWVCKTCTCCIGHAFFST